MVGNCIVSSDFERERERERERDVYFGIMCNWNWCVCMAKEVFLWLPMYWTNQNMMFCLICAFVGFLGSG
jgi:hypothetical protein